MRYIENSGWDEYIFQKSKDSNNFSDEAFQRIYLTTNLTTSVIVDSLKKTSDREMNVYSIPDSIYW